MVVFPGAPFPSYEETLGNGPEQSRARGVGAAKRTLDGEDCSGTWAERERGRGLQGLSTMAGGLGQRRERTRVFLRCLYRPRASCPSHSPVQRFD